MRCSFILEQVIRRVELPTEKRVYSIFFLLSSFFLPFRDKILLDDGYLLIKTHITFQYMHVIMIIKKTFIMLSIFSL